MPLPTLKIACCVRHDLSRPPVGSCCLRPAANWSTSRAPFGFAFGASSVKRNCEPPRRIEASSIAYGRSASAFSAVTRTSLSLVPVSLTVTTLPAAPPARLTLAVQKSAAPTQRTVCLPAPSAGVADASVAAQANAAPAVLNSAR